jgi:ribosomal-protein-alanine N-acetyltransferase
METQIEGASLRLLDELYEIEQQCFKDEAFPKQQIAYLLAEYNSISLVARVNGEIAGFVIGRIDVDRKLPVGHILTIDVVPIHRRKGIAQQLLREIEEIFRQKGAVECCLEVREDNDAALSLYRKLGYAKIAKLDRYYGEAHGLYLKKALG